MTVDRTRVHYDGRDGVRLVGDCWGERADRPIVFLHGGRQTRHSCADVPVLLVRGRMSDLVSADKATDFIARFPTVEFVDVSGAGHIVAGDRNDAFTAAITDFIGTRG